MIYTAFHIVPLPHAHEPSINMDITLLHEERKLIFASAIKSIRFFLI